jgi:hypothetical protein
MRTSVTKGGRDDGTRRKKSQSMETRKRNSMGETRAKNGR